MIRPETLTQAAEVIKCLGHPVRLRLLEALESGEKTVSELQAYAGVSQTTASQQLGALRARDVVDFRRDGTRAYYRIADSRVTAILNCIRVCELEGEQSVA